MGSRPHKHTLDRIDPYGNYEPSNCRWANAKVQKPKPSIFHFEQAMNDFGNITCALHALLTSDRVLIRLAFRARKKLGLRGVSDLRRAIGNVSRQLIYRTLSPAELKELSS
jgi:hypothetical protein